MSFCHGAISERIKRASYSLAFKNSKSRVTAVPFDSNRYKVVFSDENIAGMTSRYSIFFRVFVLVLVNSTLAITRSQAWSDFPVVFLNEREIDTPNARAYSLLTNVSVIVPSDDDIADAVADVKSSVTDARVQVSDEDARGVFG